jgi:hypothetical protein
MLKLTAILAPLREDQYKYHFKKWKVTKNLTRSTKRKLLDKGKERADAGKRTAYSLNDKPVDSKRLLREAKNDSKLDIALKPSANGQVHIQRVLPGFGRQLGASM